MSANLRVKDATHANPIWARFATRQAGQSYPQRDRSKRWLHASFTQHSGQTPVDTDRTQFVVPLGKVESWTVQSQTRSKLAETGGHR